ncbi:hypothetical protein JK361_06940 [Streptomyces sp. 5-8]|uniref:Uncharacterized protein n=1 Tax=Streptomyces musisoli TaxID=2802280 RepID=A0ABS1NW45_9ACTN|nr:MULTISPECIES: hypothetical protein [Streptomyces]MBL1104341.1 hypothetical protein [Streptomyces musisoli]MBY8840313.1 hypothetical protein [Streptomyces sp. SP2-10]
MAWWGWLVLLVAVIGLGAAATLSVQAKRRAGTVIAVREGRRSGRGGPR